MSYFHLPDLSRIPRIVHPSCVKLKKFRVTSHILGEGSYGQVMTACDHKNCGGHVGKIVKFHDRYDLHYVYNMFFAECLITKFAGEKGFGAKLDAYSLCKNESNDNVKGLMIMERLDSDFEHIKDRLTFEDYKTLFELIKRMHSFGILHRDLLPRNVMVRYKENKNGMKTNEKIIRIIDFGIAIPFGHAIPGPFRAIDYINSISDVDDIELKTKCEKEIIRIIGKKAFDTGQEWLGNHYDKCTSEYELLQYLPQNVVKNYGPATVDLTVWSVRCKDSLNDDIVEKTNERVNQVMKQQHHYGSKKQKQRRRSYSTHSTRPVHRIVSARVFVL